MCGRFTLNTTGNELARQFELLHKLDWQPRFNIAPTQQAPIIIAGRDGNHGRIAMWGLVPFWAKDISMSARLINARSESVAQKPSFREALKKRRCLVPASGYFEWQKCGRDKLPWYFRDRNHELLAFAGLWEKWRNPDPSRADSVLESFTILTVPAHADMGGIHDRMPLILPRSAQPAWLKSGQLKKMPEAHPEGCLKHFRVSTRVNRPTNDDAKCIEAIPPDDRLF